MRSRRVFTFLSWSDKRLKMLPVMYFGLVLTLAWWGYGKELAAWWQPIGQSISRIVWEEAFALTEWSEDSLADIFASTIPLWNVKNEAGQDQFTLEEPVPQHSFMRNLMGIEFGQPATYLQEGIPLLAMLPPSPETSKQKSAVIPATTEVELVESKQGHEANLNGEQNSYPDQNPNQNPKSTT